MINLLLFLFFVACASFAVALVVDNPGSVTMLWFDYQIETSVAFVLLLIALAFALTTLLTLLVRRVIFAPSRFLQRRNVRQLKSGISELTYGIAALATSNIDAAEMHVRKVEKLLGRTPLTLLLSAQIAKTRGDEGKTQILLAQLLEYKETEYLATRSLSDNASKQDNLPKALQLAIKAQALNPKDSATALAVVSLQTRMKHWHEALENLKKANLPRKEKSRIRALIQLAYGELLLEDKRDESALVIARSVISVLPNFTPAVAFVARAYSKNNMLRKATSIIIRAWKKNPTVLLADAMHDVTSLEPEKNQEKLRSLLSGGAQDGVWLCKKCNHEQKKWALHCNSCNGFDSLNWK